jgi:hypothetical protein
MSKLGSPVTGEQFFGRKTLLENAMELLNDGNHLLIAAPRRVGKSSFALKLLDLLRNEGWEGIYVDVEGTEDETGVARKIVEALEANNKLMQKAGTAVGEFLKRVNFKASIPGAELTVGTAKSETNYNVLDELGKIINKIDNNFLIIVDELPVFLLHLQKQDKGDEKVKNILSRLRSYRIEAATNQNKISWIFCGSIGLQNFTKKYGLSATINDIYSFPVGAFEPEEATEFLKTKILEDNLPVQENQIQYILDKIGWHIPFYMNLLMTEIKFTCKKNVSVTNEEIDLAYQNTIVKNKAQFDTWRQRLKEQLTATQYEKAMKILDATVKNPAGESSQNLTFILYKNAQNSEKKKEELRELLDLLEHDGYLIQHENKFVFRSPFIWDWWKNFRNL